MSVVFGRYGASRPRFGRVGGRVAHAAARRWLDRGRMVAADSETGQAAATRVRARLANGEPAHLVGLSPAGHNTGVALVRVDPEGGVELLANDEEERFAAVKHCGQFPRQTLDVLRGRLDERGIRPDDVDAWLTTFDYARLVGLVVEGAWGEFPHTWRRNEMLMEFDTKPILELPAASRRVARRVGLAAPPPIVAQDHHDCHAAFSLAASPFAHDEDVAVLVVDGTGDTGTITVYRGRRSQLTRVWCSRDGNDSLGLLYGLLSSTQGGWTPLSSEGRYMGAAAWGDGDRLTNPYYRRLREILHLGSGPAVHLNRALASWPRRLMSRPYTPELEAILGPPIPTARMWKPDAVLSVDEIQHSAITRERVDKAAAVQMVLEDALCHVVDHIIRATGVEKLVFCGGVALNCLVSMRLLDHFDERYYEHVLGRSARLHLWVPPTANDSGGPPGAAYAFALACGARPGAPLRHAFYCGRAPSSREIEEAIAAHPDVEHRRLGSVAASNTGVADLIARTLAADGVVGLFQGVAETGPRALGHRSILANPANPRTREVLNARVKHREHIRPLAPMATRAAAEELFALSPGASDDDFNAYNYMVLTARARPRAHDVVPAVVHRDGTARVQIVREDSDPLSHAILRALGRRIGAEVAVNTSLNVGAPIAQTPAQALTTLARARGMDGLVMIGDDGEAFAVFERGTDSMLREAIDGAGDRAPAVLDAG